MISVNDVFSKIEKSAEAWKLTPKETNTLRLLGEEMLGLAEGNAVINSLEFFVKTEEKNFELRLVAKAKITPEQKKQFVSASTEHKNEMSKGLKGKIKSMFDDFFYIEPNTSVPDLGLMPGVYDGYVAMWSMNEYTNTVSIDEQKKDWDGLEKSILLNFADDVIIGASLGQVDIIVKKSF